MADSKLTSKQKYSLIMHGIALAGFIACLALKHNGYAFVMFCILMFMPSGDEK